MLIKHKQLLRRNKMKIFKLLILSVILILTASCQNKSTKSDQNIQLRENGESDNSILEFYRQYSSYTDPGEYKYMYENLPVSLPELCSLINSQFIHPYAELPKYRDDIPQERWNETLKYPTVNSILEGFISFDSRGIVNSRKPEHRLVLGCRHNAILLASIMKYRGTPARVRYGHVNYLRPGFNMSHTICEIWNDRDKRWMLVDPSTNMIDFSSEDFDFSNELWLKLQNKEIDPKQYGFPGRYTGLVSIVGKISPDLAALLGTEYPVNQYAPILEYAFQEDEILSSKHIELLNKLSDLMNSIDASTIPKLQNLYDNTPEIQISKTF